MILGYLRLFFLLFRMKISGNKKKIAIFGFQEFSVHVWRKCYFCRVIAKGWVNCLSFFVFRIDPTSFIWSANSLFPDAFNVNVIGKFKDHFGLVGLLKLLSHVKVILRPFRSMIRTSCRECGNESMPTSLRNNHMKNWMETNQTSLYIMSSREYGSNVWM